MQSTHRQGDIQERGGRLMVKGSQRRGRKGLELEGLASEMGKTGIFTEIGGKKGRTRRDRQVWVAGEEVERVLD